jgi:hypothetical protein
VEAAEYGRIGVMSIDPRHLAGFHLKDVRTRRTACAILDAAEAPHLWPHHRRLTGHREWSELSPMKGGVCRSTEPFCPIASACAVTMQPGIPRRRRARLRALHLTSAISLAASAIVPEAKFG